MFGMTLLLMQAPPIPPIRIPIAIIIILSGNKPGHGPESIKEMQNKNTPTLTIFPKFFFFSWTQLRAIEVRVKVIVSIENTIPINHTGRLSCFNLICKRGSLNVKLVREAVMQRAETRI